MSNFIGFSLWFSVSSLCFLRVIESVTQRVTEKTQSSTEHFSTILFVTRQDVSNSENTWNSYGHWLDILPDHLTNCKIGSKWYIEDRWWGLVVSIDFLNDFFKNTFVNKNDTFVNKKIRSSTILIRSSTILIRSSKKSKQWFLFHGTLHHDFFYVEF